eukprot:CAMPEP_0196782140 /NCGR_PEP_ID=MMETSP1104-20130614/10794_1 /TAXON_ID=33652 /ORGANISM="Cafeteria sp., Strain Caron Lab Isolate" /LENGTH=197 /DNA_ID=CAMNT_0042152371 /DNA_START=37 /DNA_END=630 /DNA_ORIENTATION=+
MGMGGVGKSAITARFTNGTFSGRYDPTIEDSYTKTIVVDGKAIQLEILDTAGQEQYSALRETFMHTGHGFILVYSIADDATFEGLTPIRDEILKVHPNPKVPMLLVGNKKDMESERAVTVEEAQAQGRAFDGCQFTEVSAKTNEGVTELFQTIVRDILARDPSAGTSDGAAASGVLGAGQVAPTAKAGKKKKLCTLL